MKIISWNVNGIRAALGHGLKETLEKLSADVVFLQETKLSEGVAFPLEIEGYQRFSTLSKVKKGYSGVAFLTKESPLSVHYGLANGEYDEEGRVITLEFPSFFLVGAYVPNSGEELKRLPFRMEYEEKMRAYLLSLAQRKPIVYTGDMNVAHEEIDLKNPDSNHKSAGFTDEERTAFSALLSAGFVDTFRYLHGQEVAYSWWSYRFRSREKNIGWRIDYFLASPVLLGRIKESSILSDVMGSDHCPIELVIE